MTILQVQQVARLFGGDILFENASMEIHATDKIGLVGRNGAGKSTLLKMIAGIEEVDQGAIAKNKQLTIGYLAQNTGLNSNKTVYDEMLQSFQHLKKMEQELRTLEMTISKTNPQNATSEQLLKKYEQLHHDFQEMNGYSYENEIRNVLHGFHFDASFYQKKIATLSGGQKTRLALAKLLLQKPDLLVLDEPTNHLDVQTLSWLENYLNNYSKALLIVSHDRYFLDKVTNQTYELSRGKLRHFHGNYSKYLTLKAALYEQEKKYFDKQQTEIAKLEDFVARNLARASTTNRAKSRRKQLEKMQRLEKPSTEDKSVHFGFSIEKPSGQMVLSLENGAIGYSSTNILSSPVQVDIRRQDAICLIGENGVGKSTLLRSILGKIPLIQGEIRLGTNVSMGYYDQEQANLSSVKTVLQEVWDEHPLVAEKDIRTILGGFLFTGDDVKKAVPLLSGGEKARVALAKLAMNHQNFLLLDEPTNHLDIDNKEVLENALIDYEGTLFFVSHDRYFINRIATKILELDKNGTTLYLGDYDYYLEKKEELRLIEEAKQKNLFPEQVPSEESSRKKNYQDSKESQKIFRKQSRLVEQLELEMQELETRISEVQQEMAKASEENLVDVLNQLNTELNEKSLLLDEKIEAWTVASEKLETLK